MSKKKLLINGVLILSLSMSLIGCGTKGDNISNPTNTRFITTKSSYKINGNNYKIIVDNETDNVYLSSHRAYGNDTFPLLDEDGKPIKYNDLKK